MKTKYSNFRTTVLASFGLAIVSGPLTGPVSANTGPSNSFSANLANIQEAIRAGNVNFVPIERNTNGVDGSHAIQTKKRLAQSRCGSGEGWWRNYDGEGCRPGFAQ